MIFYLLITVLITMAVSLVGVVFLSRVKHIQNNIGFPIAFSVGAFLAITFFHLIPEIMHLNPEVGMTSVLVGILGSFVLSRYLIHFHTHHQKVDEACDHCDPGKQASAHLVLLGDFIHNFVDGVLIASSFAISIPVGIATAIGVWGHELAQEIADFFILIRGGYTMKKALLLNALASSSIVLGALIGYYFVETVEGSLVILLGLASGNLLYIAVSDLLPELRSEDRTKDSQKHFLGYLLMIALGIGSMLFALSFHTDSHDTLAEEIHTEEEERSAE